MSKSTTLDTEIEEMVNKSLQGGISIQLLKDRSQIILPGELIINIKALIQREVEKAKTKFIDHVIAWADKEWGEGIENDVVYKYIKTRLNSRKVIKKYKHALEKLEDDPHVYSPFDDEDEGITW